ncbi:MAG: YaaR family protein, partial [Clostridiales bacterium]|nr:YaaR family protein [Clostridiales bacterium]
LPILLISEFLETAVGNSRKFMKKSLLDRRGRHRVYSIIKKINEEVDQLTQDVMKNESGNIDILRRVDDIRGLILDMIL